MKYFHRRQDRSSSSWPTFLLRPARLFQGYLYQKRHRDRARQGRRDKCDICQRTREIPRRLLWNEFFKAHADSTEAGLSCEVIDSFLLHTDIDEKEDLVELLTHGTGKSRKYLEDLGFVLSAENGRVIVERKTAPGIPGMIHFYGH